MTAKPAKKRPQKPIYFDVRRVIDKETGEELGALVPSSLWDRKEMAARKYAVNTQVRADLRKPRNVKFHRLAHALGTLIRESFDECAQMDAHDALKHMQSKAGVCCVTVEYDIPGVGKLTRTEPRSIAFDSMDEGEFSQLFKGICDYLPTLPQWASLTPDQVRAFVVLMEPI